MDLRDWLTHAAADAETRGLPQLTPLLETLARSTQALRDADGEFGHPAFTPPPSTAGDDDPA